MKKILYAGFLTGLLMPLSFAAASGYDYFYNYPYNNYYYGYNSYTYAYPPTCSITLDNYSNTGGYASTARLSWHSQNAKSAYLSPDFGSVPVNDTRTVYPYGYTTYTLTVYGYNGEVRTCQTTSQYVAYNNNYGNYTYPYSYPNYSYAYPSYTYPNTYQYVTLNQMPYTGFDFGTIGNSIYWVSLALLALSAAYLVFYMLGMQTPALAREVGLAMRNQVRAVKSIVEN